MAVSRGFKPSSQVNEYETDEDEVTESKYSFRVHKDPAQVDDSDDENDDENDDSNRLRRG